MQPQFQRIVSNRPLQVAAGVLVVYALLGFLLLPLLAERLVPDYVRDTLHREATIGAVHVNPFLLSFAADDVKLNEADGKPIAGVRRLVVDFDAGSLWHWTWTFSAIRVEGLDLHLDRGPKGELNLAALIDSIPRDPRAVEPKPDAEPAPLNLAHVEIVDGRVSYLDRAGSAPASIAITPLTLDVKNLSTVKEQRAALTLNATLKDGGKVAGQGELLLRPFTASGKLSIKGFPSPTAWRFLRDHLKLAEFKGVIDLDSSFHAAPGKDATLLTLSDMRLHVAGLDIRERDAKAPLLALETLDASGGTVDLNKHTVTLPQLMLSNGAFGLAFAKDGTVNWGRLAVDTTPSTEPPTPWQIKLENAQIEKVAVQYDDLSRDVPLSLAAGQLDATLKLGIAIDKTTTVTADATGIDVAKLVLQAVGDKQPALTLGAASLQSGVLDTGARRVAIGQLKLSDGQTQVVRAPDRSVRLLQVLGIEAKGDATTAAAPAPWSFRLGTLQAENFKVGLVDESYRPALAVDFDAITATLKDLANDDKTSSTFEAALRVVQGGRISASGTVAPDRASTKAKLIIDKVNLAPLQPLIARNTNLSLQTGVVSAAAELDYAAQAQSDAVLSAGGTAIIDGLLLKETISGERFLACNSIAATGIHYRSAPGELVIDDVRVIEPDAKVLIFADRSINLIKAFEKDAVDKDADAQAAEQLTDDRRFPIGLTRVRVERGKVDYTDLSLVLPFNTKISDFHGSVTGISSDPESRATVSFDGTIEQYGTAEVEGTLSPFAPKHFTDIRSKFTNVEMPKLSPYSATFAGREIATGKLSLELEYKIEDGKLSGDNTILLDDFTLGKTVPSKYALDLPLDLAVALLTDSRGHIDIAIPVTGDLTKPDFALGKVIGQAVMQAFTKIVTAPFRALGALLGGGGGGQQFDAVSFYDGSAKLMPPQLEKLKQLGNALAQRPQLKLVVTGRYDPKRDAGALRAFHVRRAVSEQLDIALEAGERAAPVVFDEAKSQRALEAVFAARAGDKAVDKFAAQYEAQTGKPVTRVNPVLAVFGKPSPDGAFYQALYKELVKNQTLADSELTELAQERADTIIQALVKEIGVAPDRVASEPPKPVDKHARDGVDATLSLSVVKK